MPFPTSSFVRNGKYLLLQKQPIGSGGVGQVYRAREVALNREVAVKQVIANLGSEHQQHAIEKLVHEASILGALSHPHIVGAHTFETDPTTGEQYLVYDFVAGGSLAAFIKAQPLSNDEAITLTLDLLDALHYLHEQGIVHRDIKPSNILVAYNAQRGGMEALLTDFGIARHIHHLPSAYGLDDMPSLTPEYCAPEQYDTDQPPDPRSDLYAVGLVLAELLYGGGPYKLRQHTIQHETNALPGNSRLARIINRAVSDDPQKRFQTAAAFSAALQSLRPRRRLLPVALAKRMPQPGRVLVFLSIVLLLAGFPLVNGMPFADTQPPPTISASRSPAAASTQRPLVLIFVPEKTATTTPTHTNTPLPLPIAGVQRVAPSRTAAPTMQPTLHPTSTDAAASPTAPPTEPTSPAPSPSATALRKAQPWPTRIPDRPNPPPSAPSPVVPW